MTYRERILAAIRGETPDRLPFVPRLEFWVRARRHGQSLPPEFRSLTLMEIADRLGVGYYAVVPDFTDYSGDEMVDRALGIIRLAVLPFQISLEGVDRRVLSYGQRTVVEYHTPVGKIRTACEFTPEMIASGVSDAYVTDHAIRELRDFEVVGYCRLYLFHT